MFTYLQNLVCVLIPYCISMRTSTKLPASKWNTTNPPQWPTLEDDLRYPIATAVSVTTITEFGVGIDRITSCQRLEENADLGDHENDSEGIHSIKFDIAAQIIKPPSHPSGWRGQWGVRSDARQANSANVRCRLPMYF